MPARKGAEVRGREGAKGERLGLCRREGVVGLAAG